MSSLACPFSLVGSTYIEKLILNSVVANLFWTCPNLKQVSLNSSHIDATHKCSQDHSLLVLCFLVLLYIDLNILISVILIWLDTPESIYNRKFLDDLMDSPSAKIADWIIYYTISTVKVKVDYAGMIVVGLQELSVVTV